MKKVLVKLLYKFTTERVRAKILKVMLFVIPFQSWKQKICCLPPSELAFKYCAGKNGVEIGGSAQNTFHLEGKGGAYANVNFDVSQSGKWQIGSRPDKQINIVANGDDLPFKDDCLDYVISSHVIEHFFDPIKAIEEWLRVVKKGGVVFMIIPHKERTFDMDREITFVDELIRRYSGELIFSDYAEMTEEEFMKTKGSREGAQRSDNPHILIKDIGVPEGWQKFKEDDHHHWCVWDTESFVELVKKVGWDLLEVHDVDDKVGNGFTIVLKK